MTLNQHTLDALATEAWEEAESIMRSGRITDAKEALASADRCMGRAMVEAEAVWRHERAMGF